MVVTSCFDHGCEGATAVAVEAASTDSGWWAGHRDVGSVNLDIGSGCDGQLMSVQSAFTSEVPIDVVGHVDRRWFVGRGSVADRQLVTGQLKRDTCFHLAGEAHFAGFTLVTKHDTPGVTIGLGIGRPGERIEPVGSAVQLVHAFV